MPLSVRLALLVTFVWPALAFAQSLQIDGALAFTTRDEVAADPDGDDDSDILRLITAASWSLGDGRLRAALEFGLGDSDEAEYSGLAGGELLFARRVGQQRYGLGGRLRASDQLGRSTEIAYIAEHLGDTVYARGMGGVQAIADTDEVVGRDDDLSFFALGEAGVYLSPNFALSAAVMADGDGEVYGLGAEFSPSAATGISLFVEYGEAIGEYRDDSGYDELAVGLRFVPGAGNLRAARREGLGRMMQRFVEVQ